MKSRPDDRVLLNFGAVDWESAIYVNGALAGEHRGGYDPFSVDITDFLKPAGDQELAVIRGVAHGDHAERTIELDDQSIARSGRRRRDSPG